MRIYGSNGAVGPGPGAAARRAGSGSFSLPDAGASTEAKSAAAPRALSGIDALIALQGVDSATERRRGAVKRGRQALDVLDDLKIGLLAGSLDGVMVQRLRAAAAELKSGSGDVGLDQVLSEIELRVEVELAKVAAA
jgi:hypothetical protein